MSDPECGSYSLTISSSSYTGTLYCDSKAVCAINTQVGLWGCVTTSFSLPVETGFVGYASFNLACLNNSDYNSNCDEACALFTSRTTCSDPAFPSCATFVLNSDDYSYSSYYCADASTAILVDGQYQELYKYNILGPQSVPGYAFPSPTASSAAPTTVTTSPASPASTVSSTTAQNTGSSSQSSAVASSNAGQPLAYTPYTPGASPSTTTTSPNGSIPPPVSQTQSPTSSSTSLSPGAAAGIGAGVSVVGLTVLALVVLWFLRRRERAREAKERSHTYTLESKNGEYYKSPDVKSTASTYLDYPYTAQMNMQEMGPPKEKEDIPMPVSPNSEISGRTQMRFSTVSQITGVSALPSPSEAGGMSSERSELPTEVMRDGTRLGIAELEATEKR